MIAECPRCGAAIPMDVDTDARTHLERGECPRCRFVATTATRATTSSTAGSRRAVADGGRELELEEIESGSEVGDR